MNRLAHSTSRITRRADRNDHARIHIMRVKNMRTLVIMIISITIHEVIVAVAILVIAASAVTLLISALRKRSMIVTRYELFLKKTMDTFSMKLKQWYGYTIEICRVPIFCSSRLQGLDVSANDYCTEHEYYIDVFSDIDGTTAAATTTKFCWCRLRTHLSATSKMLPVRLD